MNTLEGKVILITGAAQGLGKATSRVLAHAGAQVIVADIQQEKGQETVNEIKQAGGTAHFLPLDVTDEEAIKSAFLFITENFRKIDVLINNAAIDFTKSILDLTVSEWDSAMNVNLRGPFILSKYAFQLMAEAQSGYIVNIISTACLRAWSEASVYHATKWGLRGFTQALLVEGRRFHIKVTSLIVGGMKTPFLLDRFPDIDQNCLQEPENVSQKILYLLSDESNTVVPEILILPFHETSWP